MWQVKVTSCQGNEALALEKSVRACYMMTVSSVYHWECANTTANNLDLSKAWYCVSRKQARLISEQEETILDLQRQLVLAHSQIASLKADNSSSSKCN
jgi:hypothetical protein